VIRLPLVRGLLNPAISVEWFFNGLVTAFVAAFRGGDRGLVD
jgi:hypothetical protein